MRRGRWLRRAHASLRHSRCAAETHAGPPHVAERKGGAVAAASAQSRSGRRMGPRKPAGRYVIAQRPNAHAERGERRPHRTRAVSAAAARCAAKLQSIGALHLPAPTGRVTPLSRAAHHAPRGCRPVGHTTKIQAAAAHRPPPAARRPSPLTVSCLAVVAGAAGRRLSNVPSLPNVQPPAWVLSTPPPRCRRAAGWPATHPCPNPAPPPSACSARRMLRTPACVAACAARRAGPPRLS